MEEEEVRLFVRYAGLIRVVELAGFSADSGVDPGCKWLPGAIPHKIFTYIVTLTHLHNCIRFHVGTWIK